MLISSTTELNILYLTWKPGVQVSSSTFYTIEFKSIKISLKITSFTSLTGMNVKKMELCHLLAFRKTMVRQNTLEKWEYAVRLASGEPMMVSSLTEQAKVKINDNSDISKFRLWWLSFSRNGDSFFLKKRLIFLNDNFK